MSNAPIKIIGRLGIQSSVPIGVPIGGFFCASSGASFVEGWVALDSPMIGSCSILRMMSAMPAVIPP